MVHSVPETTASESTTPVTPGLGSIQFRNWNCRSIPIPIPELELKLVELKMELELKSLELELELKTGIEFFATVPQHLLVNQPFSNFNFTRGHNLWCDWLLMQQIYLLTSWDIAPCGVVTKDYGEGTLFPLSRQRPEGLKMVTIKNQLTTMTQTKLLSLLNKWMIAGLGVKLSRHVNLFQSHFTDWYLQIFHDNPLR